MPDFSNLPELLKWAISLAGLTFFATWLKIAIDHLRNPKTGVEYSPYVQKLSEWMQNLNPLQMQTLSWVVFVVPAVIIYVVVNVVPAAWILAVQPHLAFIISLLTVYAGQQWAHRSTKSSQPVSTYAQTVVQEATNVNIDQDKPTSMAKS